MCLVFVFCSVKDDSGPYVAKLLVLQPATSPESSGRAVFFEMSTLTQKRLQEALDYNPETGVFTWRIARRTPYGYRALPGDVAGNKPGGYIKIGIFGKTHPAHHLAWLFVYGCFPNGRIDHKNRNTSDNRIGNLRIASVSQNAVNAKSRVPGQLKGVSFNKNAKKWVASVCKNYKRTYLGLFDTEREAHEAHMRASRQLHGEFARAS